MSIEAPIYWLVGASEGLGRAIAKEMDERGYRLILSARSHDRLESLAAELRNDARIVPFNLRDNASVEKAVARIGEIDGIIYCAGAYEPMSAQCWNPKISETIAEVNFMGAIRVLSLTVPEFTERNSGHIVIIGSLSGYRGLPQGLVYGASKAGLMHLAEALRADLWKTGVKVQLFNLGFIRTRLTAKNDFPMPFLQEPDQMARSIVRRLSSRRFKYDFPFRFSLIFRVGRLLPQATYEKLFTRA